MKWKRIRRVWKDDDEKGKLDKLFEETQDKSSESCPAQQSHDILRSTLGPLNSKVEYHHGKSSSRQQHSHPVTSFLRRDSMEIKTVDIVVRQLRRLLNFAAGHSYPITYSDKYSTMKSSGRSAVVGKADFDQSRRIDTWWFPSH